MAVRTLPGFRSLSEFGAYHGDCGECAALGVLHTLDPQRFPLTLTELNHLTSDAIAHSEADAALSGGMNIPHLDAMLARLGIAHTAVGYADFTIDKLHADLKANAGARGVIVEWSRGGALPGDEPGVQYHYSSCGGIDTGPAGDGIGGCYLWCDGDNSASTKADGGSNALRYTWSQVVAAAPIAYILVTMAPVVPTPPPPDKDTIIAQLTALCNQLKTQVATLQTQLDTATKEESGEDPHAQAVGALFLQLLAAAAGK